MKARLSLDGCAAIESTLAVMRIMMEACAIDQGGACADGGKSTIGYLRKRGSSACPLQLATSLLVNTNRLINLNYLLVAFYANGNVVGTNVGFKL